jgi:transposase-like protein
VQRWVLGAYDTEQKVGWIQFVENRSSESLIPIIQSWCLPGTIIVTDGWSAYSTIEEYGFTHEVVIHERYFVDPLTGVHTNNVENYWMRCKRRLKRMFGTSYDLLPSHIDEFLWNERYGDTISDRWSNLLVTIRSNYQ